MIKLGTQNISALHLGGQEIKKAYMGETLVLGEEKKPSRLPEGYTEIEYIEASGTQYINTNVKPTSKIKFTVDIEPLTKPTEILDYMMFAQSQYVPSSSGASKYFFILKFGSNGLQISQAYVTSSATYKTISTNNNPRRMVAVVDYPNKKALIEGESELSLTGIATSTSMTTISILKEPSNRKNDIKAKLYSCQIEVDGASVRDFVPCSNPSGAVGLYDLVGAKFYGNAGTGVLSAGPAV